MAELITKENLKVVLKTLIGSGAIKYFSSSRSISVSAGDVVIKKNDSGLYTIYKCKISGSYSIPTPQAFKEISLRS